MLGSSGSCACGILLHAMNQDEDQKEIYEDEGKDQERRDPRSGLRKVQDQRKMKERNHDDRRPKPSSGAQFPPKSKGQEDCDSAEPCSSPICGSYQVHKHEKQREVRTTPATAHGKVTLLSDWSSINFSMARLLEVCLPAF